MKLSVVTSVFVNYPLDAAVEQVISTDTAGIDIWCGRPHMYRKDFPEDVLLALKKRIAGSGLTVVSVLPAFFRYPYSLSSPVEAICADSIHYMKECIDNAVIVGAGQVLAVPTNALHSQTEADAQRIFTRSLAKICEHAETHGIKLGIEIVQPKLSCYMNRTTQGVNMIRDLQSDALGIVLDTGHLNLSGEGFEAALDIAGGHLLNIHINDNNGIEQQNAIPGDGTFDFGTMAGLLKKYHYQGFISIELGWNYSFDPFPAVAEAVKRINTYIE